MLASYANNYRRVLAWTPQRLVHHWPMKNKNFKLLNCTIASIPLRTLVYPGHMTSLPSASRDPSPSATFESFNLLFLFIYFLPINNDFVLCFHLSSYPPSLLFLVTLHLWMMFCFELLFFSFGKVAIFVAFLDRWWSPIVPLLLCHSIFGLFFYFFLVL